MSHVAEGNSTKPEGLFLCPVGFYLRAQRATRLLFFPRESSSLASFPLRRIARRVLFILAWDRVSIPARTRQKSPGLCPDPPLPLAALRVTGRVRTTRAPLVRVVVTRVAFCVYNTKCRRKAASWLLRSMTLRSHFGTCPAPAGKCALKRAVRSLSFANKAQPFALARVIIICVDYQSTRMQETEKISHRPPAACEKSGELCHRANTSACESPKSNR